MARIYAGRGLRRHFQKIELETERARLKNLAETMRQNGEGVILRTNAEGESQESLAEDLEALRRAWRNIVNRSREANAPSELHRDSGLVERMVRDVITPDTEQLIIDDRISLQAAKDYLRQTAPALEGKSIFTKKQSHYSINTGSKSSWTRLFNREYGCRAEDISSGSRRRR